MRCFYFRAYDEAGQKRSGTMEAPDRQAADAALRKNGLRPYFVNDYEAVKKAARAQRKRQRIIVAAGAGATVFALILSGWIVEYAGRERAPNIVEYRETGLVEDSSGAIVAKTKEERDFALEIYKSWEGFYPGMITGIEVKKVLMTIYVPRRIHDLPDSELEMMASNTVRALQRRFETSGCTLLIVEGNEAVMEANYTALPESMRVKSYR